MTKTPTLATYTGNTLVPITSKASFQQTRFLHTKAKSKMSAGTAPSAATSTTTVPKQKGKKPKPVDVLRKILSNTSSTAESVSAPAQTGAADPQTKAQTSQAKTLTFQKPPEEDIAAYDLETVKAIRSNNVDKLRQLWCSGKSMNACNQFGESVLHMACRRGYANIVGFLLREVKVRSDRCDDFGRNPFHDALWTSTPNFEVVDLLIEYADPALMLSEDVRGNHPFAYARSDHSEQWIDFLEKRREKIIKRFQGTNAGDATSATKVEIVG